MLHGVVLNLTYYLADLYLGNLEGDKYLCLQKCGS